MAGPRADYEFELLEAVKGGLIDKVKDLLTSNIKLNDESYFDYDLIIKALDSHYVGVAKLLIENGFRVHKQLKSIQERTVLHAAAAIQSKDKDLIKILIAKGASPDILNYNEQNKTPLHIAIDGYRLLTIKLFLSQCDTESLDEQYFLHHAILQGKTEVVMQLVKKGLSMKKKNKEGLTPFFLALKNSNFEILNILLSNYSIADIDPNSYDDIAPVYMAGIRGNLQFVQEYVNSGLPINIPLKWSTNLGSARLDNFLGFTLLHFAVKHVNLELVTLLLSLGADIFIKNENGSTPLHIAFESKEEGIWDTCRQDSIIDQILKTNKKLKSNPINENGLTHFHIACSRDENTVVEHFLNLGVSINQPVNSKDHRYKKFSPLHFAAKFSCKNTMEVLLQNGADVNQPDCMGMTALHIAVQESCLEVINLLLQHDADVAFVNSEGNTPVHLALREWNYDIVDLLLSVSNVANSNPTNSDGLSHFHIACTRDNVEVVKSFIEKRGKEVINTCVPIKMDLNENSNDAVWSGSSPLHFAAHHRAKSNVIEWSGYSPLHFAVHCHKAKIMQLLLHKGADIDLEDSNGHTPIDIAYNCYYEFLNQCCTRKYSRTRDTDGTTIFHTLSRQFFLWDNMILIVPTLAKITVCINSQDSEGFTAHHIACDRKNYNALEILLMYGANINIEDNVGRTVCCCIHEKYLQNFSKKRDLPVDVHRMMTILQKHIIKMVVLGLPVNKKVILSSSKFDCFEPLTDCLKIKLISDCQIEMQALKDTKIYANCTLYDVMFKDENALAQIRKNPTFEDIVFSNSFKSKYPNYSYFIDLQLEAGVYRADLLPVAKLVLNELSQLVLPDICSENICKYFNNYELGKLIIILHSILDLKMDN